MINLRPRSILRHAQRRPVGFLRILRSQYRFIRGNRWTRNFAAVEVLVPDQGVQIYHAFNAGEGAQHSEEVLAAIIRALPAGAMILTAFSDRSLCPACQNFFMTSLRARNCDFVYYIVRYNSLHANFRAQEIRAWWTA